MKLHPLKLTAFALTLTAAFTAAATPLQRSDISADATWLVHLDCDQLHPTALGQYILAEMDKPEAQAKLAAFQSIFTIDLRTQLHALSLYGPNQENGKAVLIVYADFDADRLVTLAKAAKQYHSTTHKSHTIHSYVDDHIRGHRHGDSEGDARIYAAIDGHRVIFGQREEQIARALDTIDGSTASIAKSKEFSALGESGTHHFLEAAGSKIDSNESNPNAAILKLTKSAQLVAGEEENNLRASLTLDTASDEVAANVLSIAQGLEALMKLRKDPNATRLADALAVKQDGAHVIITLNLPSTEAVEMIKAGAAHKAAKHSTDQQ